MRIAAQVHLEPWTDRDSFAQLVRQGLESAGATEKLLSDPAMEMLYRSSRGLARVTSRLLRAALREAHERDQNFVDEHIMEAAVDDTFAVAAQ